MLWSGGYLPGTQQAELEFWLCCGFLPLLLAPLSLPYLPILPLPTPILTYLPLPLLTCLYPHWLPPIPTYLSTPTYLPTYLPLPSYIPTLPIYLYQPT
jgi:hypothetical protein